MKLLVSPSPHIRSGESTRSIMIDVLIALLPATLGGIFFFGVSTILLIAASIASAVLAELIYQMITKQQITISDCSAAVTGLLIALNIPPHSPIWMPVIGSAFAIIIVKQLFGGVGHNFMNPALVARAVLMVSWTARMSTFVLPFSGADAVAMATPLSSLKDAVSSGAFTTISVTAGNLWQMFIGSTGGCIGETSELLLLVGGLYLLVRKVITVRIPLSFIASMFVMLTLLSPFQNPFGYSLYNLFSGGLFLGAIFMATDYSSSPMTTGGQWIYGVGCGIIAAVIRRFGTTPEGVSYAILIMNVAAPLISKYTAPKSFGRQVPKNA